MKKYLFFTVLTLAAQLSAMNPYDNMHGRALPNTYDNMQEAVDVIDGMTNGNGNVYDDMQGVRDVSSMDTASSRSRASTGPYGIAIAPTIEQKGSQLSVENQDRIGYIVRVRPDVEDKSQVLYDNSRLLSYHVGMYDTSQCPTPLVRVTIKYHVDANPNISRFRGFKVPKDGNYIIKDATIIKI